MAIRAVLDTKKLIDFGSFTSDLWKSCLRYREKSSQTSEVLLSTLIYQSKFTPVCSLGILAELTKVLKGKGQRRKWKVLMHLHFPLSTLEGGLIMERYIDPTTDFGFKKLFGEEANKDIIMSFIQDVLELEKPLSEITFLDKEQLPESSEERIGVYDIFCKNEDGSYFIVEMQKNKIDFMKDRMVYYSTFPIVAQAKRGRIPVEINGKRKEIPWDYELSPIYCIAILDFAFNEEDAACVKRNSIRDDKPPHNLFYDKLRYITIELPLFDERKPECSLDKHLNKWLYLLKELPNFEEMPEIFKGDVIFEKTFEVAEIAKFTKEERRYYERSLKRSRDSYAVIEYAKKEAREEAKEERTIEIARSMLQKKMDISLISELTGLSEEEIAKLED